MACYSKIQLLDSKVGILGMECVPATGIHGTKISLTSFGIQCEQLFIPCFLFQFSCMQIGMCLLQVTEIATCYLKSRATAASGQYRESCGCHNLCLLVCLCSSAGMMSASFLDRPSPHASTTTVVEGFRFFQLSIQEVREGIYV